MTELRAAAAHRRQLARYTANEARYRSERIAADLAAMEGSVSYFATGAGFAFASTGTTLERAQELAVYRARFTGDCHVVERRGAALHLVETVYREGHAQRRLPFRAHLHLLAVVEGPAAAPVEPMPVTHGEQLPLFARS